MSVSIVIDCPQRIALEEWHRVVATDSELRMRTEPYFAVNPHTGATIQLPLGKGDAEMQEDGQWLPFLRWQRGRLVTEYRDEFDDPANPARQKLAAVAQKLGAVLGTDAGDEALGW